MDFSHAHIRVDVEEPTHVGFGSKEDRRRRSLKNRPMGVQHM